MSAQPSWYATQPAWYDEATEPGPGREDEGDNAGDGLDDGMFYDDEDDDQLD